MPEQVRFTIDGRPAEADAGESLLAALWNAGRRALRASVGGEPRGPLCGMGTCFECRVTIDGEPHRRSCVESVREGMAVGLSASAETQAANWPHRARPHASQRQDERSRGAPGSDAAHIAVAAAQAAGHLPETMAGDATHGLACGVAGASACAAALISERSAHPARPPGVASSAEARLSTEVVVVGGGPAGIAAAVHAAEAGARTLLVEEQARPGGQVWRHRGEPPPAARRWLERLARSGAAVLSGATVVDAAGRELVVEHGGRARRVAFGRLVLATGARELFLPFPGWTLPGVVGVGGAQALLKAGARFDGARVVVAGSGPLLLAVAAALRRAGARVVGITEQAPLARLAFFGVGLWREPRKLVEGLGYAAALAGVPFRAGAWVREAVGREAVGGVLVTDGRRQRRWDCDVLACGFGLVPSLELPRLLGCETTADGVVVDVSQQTSVPGVYAAGELLGIAGADRALTTGAIAGLAAASRPVPPALARRRLRESGFARRLAGAFAPREELLALARPDTIVCRCEDVPLGRLGAAASIREAKLHTRAGMGPCQGRVCGSLLSALRGLPADSVRSPLVPVPLAVLAEENGGSTARGAGGAPARGPRSA
jgi:NADPH-dependent 2,4-dienoyl-CoA reductase/sulfur reductase-like enzyme